MQHQQPFDYLDKACLASASRQQGVSNAPTWELVLEGQPAPQAVRQALQWLCVAYPWCAALAVPLGAPPATAAAWAWSWHDDPDIDALFEFRDLRTAADPELDALRDRIHDNFMDLLATPPLHVTLVWLPQGQCRLFLQQHHGLADGRAFIELLNDFGVLINHALLGTPPSPQQLAPVPRRPELEALGLTLWQRKWLTWSGLWEYLRGLAVSLRRPVCTLKQNASMDYRGANRTVHIAVQPEQLERWKQAARRAGANLHGLLVTTLFVAQKRWSEEGGVEVGQVNMTVVAETRPRDGSFRSFANHLAWLIPQIDLSGVKTVAPVLAEVQKQLAEQAARRAHLKRYLLERGIVLGLKMDAFRKMLYASKHTVVNLNFSNVLAIPIARLEGRGWRVTDVRITTPTMPRTAVVLTATSYDGRVTLNFNFKASICRREEVERLAMLFLQEIDGFSA